MGKKVPASSYIPPVSLLLFVLLSPAAFAAIPLVTDDTGTQGKGKFQLELFGEYGHDELERIASSSSGSGATLTYGISDPVDAALTIPYQYIRTKDSPSVIRSNGVSDIAMDLKWRFYEGEGLSLALKPGLSLPTGDEQRSLGAGRATYYLYLITSKEAGPWAIHMNLRYVRNENILDQRKNLWHASIATAVEVVRKLKLVGDIGVETNPDRSSGTPLAYILGGLIYSVRNNLDLGLGVKGGLTRPEADISVRGGITWRF